jgi:negative regulator of sigma E activity
MNEHLELKLQAWLDGEVSAGEARQISQELTGNAESTRLIAQLRGLRDAMAGQELIRSVPETREFYWSKIARQIERETPAHQPAPVSAWAAWRRWLSPASGFAALACVLLLAVKPLTPPTFDEITSTGEGMEAVTFHDQSAGMTVVWLQDPSQIEQPASPEVTSAAPSASSNSDEEQGTVEME